MYNKLYDVEPHVYGVLYRGHRSILAQFRTPIKTCRFNDTPLDAMQPQLYTTSATISVLRNFCIF